MLVGFISDIHEDIVSLNKALEYYKSKKTDILICLGDITGYSEKYYKSFRDARNASECIKAVSKNCKYTVGGNHDLFSAKRIPSFTSGFKYPPDWYTLTCEERKKRSGKKVWFYEDEGSPENLSNDDYFFLSKLPEYKVIREEGINIFISHFIYPDFTGSETKFPRRNRFFRHHYKFMKNNDCNICFCGHGHYGGVGISDNRKFRTLPFGHYQIKKTQCCISVPCIANTKIKNGTTIFNTNSYELYVERLSTE